MHRFQLVLFFLLSAASPLFAQRIEDARVAADRPGAENAPRAEEAMTIPSASRTSASTRSMVVGGIIGGVLGAFGGAAAGVSIENCDRVERDNCGLAGAVIGGIVGEAIGVPIGVNYAANGTGTLGRSISVSLSITAVCLVMGYTTAGGSVLALPPLQIYTSIRTARTGRSGFLGT